MPSRLLVRLLDVDEFGSREPVNGLDQGIRRSVGLFFLGLVVSTLLTQASEAVLQLLPECAVGRRSLGWW